MASFNRIGTADNLHGFQLDGVHGVAVVAQNPSQTWLSDLTQLVYNGKKPSLWWILKCPSFIVLELTGCEADGGVARLVPETIANFWAQELVSYDAAANRT